jgi:Leucine-rich repeat (LRR) protein
LIVGSLDVDDAAIAALTRRFQKASVITSQRDAIALMRELPKPNNVSTITAGPEDLRSRFGEDHFEQAVQLNLNKIVPRQGVRGLITVKRANVIFADGISSVIADLAILPNLTAVSLYGSSFADEDMELIAASAQIEELDLQRTTISDDGLRRVGRMLGLKHLSLGDYGTQIHDEGLGHLARLVQLERLYLNRTDITDAGLIHVNGMQKLKELELRETNIDAGLLQLIGLSQLERIDLSYTNVTDDSVSSLAAIKSLKEIDVSHTRVTAAGAKSLQSRLPGLRISPGVFPDHLEEQAIVRELGTIGVRLVADQNGRVAQVDARESHEPRRVVELVGRLPQVTKLRLGSACTDADLEAISAAVTIVDVNLSDAQVSDDGVAHLQRLPHLRSLILDRTAISDAAVEHLVNHRELVWLSLAGTAITDSTLGRLAELPQLNTLLLDNTELTGRGLGSWQRNTSLKNLYVRNISTMAERNLEAFQQCMPNCRIIRTSTR